jgi:hypothetical protein
MIIKTKNYNMFRIIGSNRDVVKDIRYKRLMKSIQKYGYDLTKPIAVTSDLYIYDGQHRFEACKDLDISVHYIINPNLNYRLNKKKIESLMISENKTSKNWKTLDYIKFYASNGDDEYKEILKRVDMYQSLFGITGTVNLSFCHIAHGAQNLFEPNHTTRFIKNEIFKTVIDKIKELHGMANKSERLKDIFKSKRFNIVLFQFLISTKIDFNTFRDKLLRIPYKINKENNLSRIRENLLEFYNYQKKNKVTIKDLQIINKHIIKKEIT